MGRLKNYIGTCINGFKIHDQKRENKRTFLLAECPFCHAKKWTRADCLAKVVSCGCYNAEHNQFKRNDLAGKKFGRLTAVKPTAERDKNNGSVMWECLCSCGNKKIVSAANLVRGGVTSCGCLWKEVRIANGLKLGKQTVKKYCVEGTNLNNLTAKIPKNNTSGIKGVRWDSNRQKWVAQIRFQGKNVHLGRYSRKEDAKDARQDAEEKLFLPVLKKYGKKI